MREQCESGAGTLPLPKAKVARPGSLAVPPAEGGGQASDEQLPPAPAAQATARAHAGQLRRVQQAHGQHGRQHHAARDARAAPACLARAHAHAPAACAAAAAAAAAVVGKPLVVVLHLAGWVSLVHLVHVHLAGLALPTAAAVADLASSPRAVAKALAVLVCSTPHRNRNPHCNRNPHPNTMSFSNFPSSLSWSSLSSSLSSTTLPP